MISNVIIFTCSCHYDQLYVLSDGCLIKYLGGGDSTRPSFITPYNMNGMTKRVYKDVSNINDIIKAVLTNLT